jgi:hypothetical protein
LTSSECYIEIVDEELETYTRQQRTVDWQTGRNNPRHGLPEPPGKSPQYFWLPFVERWATERDLQIDCVDSAWIRVPVSRAQVQQFLEEVFGTAPESPVAGLLAKVINHFRNDKTYVIAVVEF